MIEQLGVTRQLEILEMQMVLLPLQNLFVQYTQQGETEIPMGQLILEYSYTVHKLVVRNPKRIDGSVFVTDSRERNYISKLIRFAMIFLSDDNRKQIEEMME